jgi:hypothetical protein
MALAQDHLDAYVVCYTKAVDRLHKLVIGHEYSATYAYYKVPSPWLQVKLLRLLQYYPPSGMRSPSRNYNFDTHKGQRILQYVPLSTRSFKPS